jgi:hypothetical protein
MKRLASFVFLVSSFVVCGCAARVASTPGQPARAASPIEKALAYNASLAESNKAVAMGVINANNQTPPLVPVDVANKILVAQSRIADFDRQLTPLLASAATVSGNSAHIALLLSEIKLAATGLGTDLGITDTKTQQAISQSIATVVSMADLVLTSLQKGGLLK